MKRKSILFVVPIILAMFISPAISSATSWAYSFVVWEGYIYVLSDEYVTSTDVVKKIGKVTSYSDMDQYGGNFSNTYKRGTPYYSMEGISTDTAIAVQESNDTYRKAVREGEYAGGPIQFSVPLISTIAVLILFGIGFAILRKNKIKKA